MKFIALVAAAAAAFVAGSAAAQQLAPSPTLDAIKARGHIECGVHLGLPGFSFANDKGEWTGLDVDYCKALAAAVLGDATKVKFTPTSVQQRWPILQSGQVDLLSRNTTITFSRNATLGIGRAGGFEALDQAVLDRDHEVALPTPFTRWAGRQRRFEVQFTGHAEACTVSGSTW